MVRKLPNSGRWPWLGLTPISTTPSCQSHNQVARKWKCSGSCGFTGQSILRWETLRRLLWVAKIRSALPRVRVRATIDLGNSRQKALNDETFTQKNLQAAQSRAKKFSAHLRCGFAQLALTRLLRGCCHFSAMYCSKRIVTAAKQGVLEQTACHLCACKRDCSGRSQNGWCCRSFSKGS